MIAKSTLIQFDWPFQISCINEEAEKVLVECASTCFKAKMKEDKNYEEKLSKFN